MRMLSHLAQTAVAGLVGFAVWCALDILTFGTADGEKRSGIFAGPALADDDDDDNGPRFSRGRPRVRGFYIPIPRVASPRRARRLPEPRGIRNEWVAAGVTDTDIGRLRSAGFTIVAQRQLGLLPEITVRLRAPRNLSTRRAQQQLRALVPSALLDRNHLYRPSARSCRADTCFAYGGPGTPLVGSCAARGTVGMIDTAVGKDHPALAGLAIETKSILGPDYRASRAGHGTEVAILLASGAARVPDFKLVAIDAFHRRRGGYSADSFDIVAALDRLVAKSVTVANLSLAGPTNAILERAGAEASKRGMIIVAAAGNDGPSSPPRYPAAYQWAVAVTAVDRRDNVYPRAVRGPHIAFAAPGVRVQLPNDALQPGPLRSGTSYAAPLVTAALSARRAVTTGEASQDVVAALAADAKDLGAPGRDPVFGWGRLISDKACLTN
jgi:hypothetical protein